MASSRAFRIFKSLFFCLTLSATAFAQAQPKTKNCNTKLMDNRVGDAPQQVQQMVDGFQTSDLDLSNHKYDLPKSKVDALRDSFCKAFKLEHRGRWGGLPCKWDQYTKLPSNSPFGSCAHFVKKALEISGLVSQAVTSLWSGGPPNGWRFAKDGGKILEKSSFKNVINEGFNSDHPPVGATLVYEGGSAFKCQSKKIACGHVEVYLGDGIYCSDFCTQHPVDSVDKIANRKNGHRLIGVYVPDNTEKVGVNGW